MKDRALPDWQHYYTPERLSEKLKSQIAYLFLIDSVEVGVVFLSTDDLYYYSPMDMSKFAQKDAPAMYISTLAVRPDFQHQGIATQIIVFCEKLARKKDVKFLRLDCNENDAALVEFYKKRGFVVCSPMEKEPFVFQAK